MKHFLFCVLFFPSILFASVSAPSLRCVSVLPNGDVVLTWLIPADPMNEFVSYKIWSSPDNATFSLEGTVNSYNTTSFTDVGAAALTIPVYYYVQTEFNDGTGPQLSSPSDTLASINVIVSSVTGNLLTVIWNPLHTPELPTSLGWYRIYQKIPPANWLLVDSTQFGNETFIDTMFVCSDSVYYRVEIGDASGCVSVSNERGYFYQDVTEPAIPVIDSVSVDTATGSVYIGWQPGAFDDTQGYIILNENTGTVDTVFGINNTFFYDNNVNGNLQSIQYGVAAFDSCWSGNPPSPNTSSTGILHRTMFLQATVFSCERKIELSWNAYEQWTSGVGSYEIYGSENGNPFTLLNTTLQTNFSHIGLTANSNYCYFIRAKEPSRTSSSNKICVDMIVPGQPTEQYLNYVTVLNSSSVEISCFVDVNAAVTKYLIQRTTDISSPFETVGEVAFTGNNIIKFTDETAQTNVSSYYYKVVAIDVCDKEIFSSNISQTIFLSALSDGENLVNKLSWNFYSDWDVKGSGVQEYRIFKGRDENSFSEINNVPSNQNTFSDDASGETSSGGKFCYYVEAHEANGNILGFKETSKSNVACDVQNPLVWIPNVFTPNGDEVNDVFKPVNAFVNPENYTFSVFNRWGDKIFYTTDVMQGWDGKVKGKLQEDEVYMYLVSYSTADGKIIKKRGTFTLLK